MSKTYTRAVASGAGAITSQIGVVGVVWLTAGSAAAATATLTDGNGGEQVAALAAPAGGSCVVPLSGRNVASGVYCSAIAGTGCAVHVEML